MAKPFSEMTPMEQSVNRARMRAGFPADWSEAVGADLGGREGDIVSGAILDHLNRAASANRAAAANEYALAQTLKRLGIDPE